MFARPAACSSLLSRLLLTTSILASAMLTPAHAAQETLASWVDVGPSAAAADERTPLAREDFGPRDDGARSALQAAPVRTSAAEFDSVVFDEPGDGALWARGRTYKARIDSRGLTFIPFLGSRAPRNFPVAFRLRSASIGERAFALHDDAAPVRDGTRVYIERGSLTEIYDFELDTVEQSFVVRRGLASGDLELQVEVTSEMTRATSTSGAWYGNPHGAVRCGWATTFDEGGRECATSSFPIDGAIAYVVPASEVARAKGDLIVDPIISTAFADSTDASWFDNQHPDVAYDVSNDRYLVAYEQVWSETDHDVVCQMIAGSTGQVIVNQVSYVDYTSNDWRQLSVGNLNASNQFLIAGSVNHGAINRNIMCRIRAANSTGVGPLLVLSSASATGTCDQPTDNVTPVVGGDPFPSGSSRFCVAWVARNFSYNHPYHFDDHAYCMTVRFSMVSPSGSASPAQSLRSYSNFVDGNTPDSAWHSLAISRSNGDSSSGASVDWNLAWLEEVNNQNFIAAARIRWNGVVSRPATRLVKSGDPLPGVAPEWRPNSLSVSTSQADAARRFLVAWDVVSGGTSRLYGAVVDPFGPWGYLPSSALLDLTQLQGTSVSQWQPSVECSGSQFLIAFNTLLDGADGTGLARFGYFHTWWSTTFGCFEGPLEVMLDHQVMGRSRIFAEASGGGARPHTMIAATDWGGWNTWWGPYSGTPVVALHSN